MKIVINENGFQSIPIKQDISSLDVYVDERVNASLLLTYDVVSAHFPIHIKLNKASTLTMFMKNDTTSLLDVELHSMIQKDASFHISYCDLNAYDTHLHGEVCLCEEGASANIKSACIVEGKKDFKISIQHQVAHTSGIMEHYAVVKEHGTYRMEAMGKIEKGAYGSVSHQTTRVLTMSEKHTSKVVPLLLIDENDVKASHATTLGQPDENQLYYLQTRGLSREQALGLLSIGYIMPIIEVLEDDDLKQQLKNEIEMKVGLHA